MTFGSVDRRGSSKFGSSKPNSVPQVANKSPEIQNRGQSPGASWPSESGGSLLRRARTGPGASERNARPGPSSPASPPMRSLGRASGAGCGRAPTRRGSEARNGFRISPRVERTTDAGTNGAHGRALRVVAAATEGDRRTAQRRGGFATTRTRCIEVGRCRRGRHRARSRASYRSRPPVEWVITIRDRHCAQRSRHP